MFLGLNVDTKELEKKWSRVLNAENAPKMQDHYRRSAMAVILENQFQANQADPCKGFFTPSALHEATQLLQEAPHANSAGSAGGTFPTNPNLQGYDPVLISMVRRYMPKLMPFDLAGVQPMTGPTGLIFALRSRYTSQGGTEALHFEPNSAFTGSGAQSDPLDPNGAVTEGEGLDTWSGEKLGTGGEPGFPEMALSIERSQVTAQTRKLKAEYSTEAMQDLKAIHNLDLESELANILSAEILAEINREFVRKVYRTAVVGAQFPEYTATGTFDMDLDSDGRWFVEKVKGLMFAIGREANQISKDTRRGRGNWIVCSSDLAEALSIAGLLDTSNGLKDNLNVDDTGDTFCGVLNGKYKVYIDPYVLNDVNFMVVGYKGSNPYDAGMFYCPYVPLQMMRAVGENSFQPKIAFQTRYGMVAHPFSGAAGVSNGDILDNANVFFRKFKVTNLL